MIVHGLRRAQFLTLPHSRRGEWCKALHHASGSVYCSQSKGQGTSVQDSSPCSQIVMLRRQETLHNHCQVAWLFREQRARRMRSPATCLAAVESSTISHGLPAKCTIFFLLLERGVKRKACVHSREPIIAAQDSRDGIHHWVPRVGGWERGSISSPASACTITFRGAEWKMTSSAFILSCTLISLHL